MEEIKKPEDGGPEKLEPIQENKPMPAVENPQVDYKAELEKAEEALTKERKARARAEFALRHKNDVDPEEPSQESDKEETPVSRKELTELLNNHAETITRQITKNEAKQLISAKVKNSDEARLVEFLLNNRVRPSGNLEEDIEDAIAMANKKRLSSVMGELKISEESKRNRGDGSGAGQKITTDKQLEIPADLMEIMNSPAAKKYGLTPEKLLEQAKKNGLI